MFGVSFKIGFTALHTVLTSMPSAGGLVALREIPPVGLSGHIMSISEWLTGIGMDGTRPFAEQAESLRPGGVVFWEEPLRLEEEELAGRRAEDEGVGLEWEVSREHPEEEEEI